MVPPRSRLIDVQALLGTNWDQKSDVTPFLATASALVDRVVTDALRRRIALSDLEAELVERWLAAHFYQAMDQGYASSTTAKAGATFQGKTGLGIEGTKYGQSALNLDVSGCLAALNKRQRATGFWLGTDCGCGTGGCW